MPKLFRKGRFNFFKGKGIGQYLLYVLLEMVLVIAGILIALEINNGNEREKNEERAFAILQEVRRDLRSNLRTISGLVENVEARDSLITRVMMDSVTPEDYRSNFAYAGLIMTYNSINFQDNGFQSMVRQSEFFSRDYDSLFTSLTSLYEDRYGVVETMQERLGDHVINTLERWSLSKPWFHQLSQGRLSEEIISFFTEDPFYLNALDIYRTYSSINILPSIREARMETSLAIAQLNAFLEPEEDPFAEFEGYAIATDLEHWQQDTGVYVLAEVIAFTLAIEDGLLTMAQEGQPSFQVYPQNDSTLLFPRADIQLVMKRDQDEMRMLGAARPQTLKRRRP